MKGWEWIVGGAAVIAIGLVIENNSGKIKGIVSNIHDSLSPTSSIYHPVSTTVTQPDLAAGKCPPGMYLDQTDGIFRCHSAGHTRELNSSVKLFNPQWQNAWAAEPNMTQPLVQPDINKQIESQIKKGHEKEVKHQKNLDDKRLIREHGNVVATQVECPKDLSKLACGSHCYKDGKLMAVDCSGQKNKPKTTTKKKAPLVIPPNFPNQVTVDPYPETEDIGGDRLPSDVNPSYPELPRQPEIGNITKEPTRQPEIGPITPEPIRQPQIGPTMPSSGPGVAVGSSSGGGCNTKDGYPSCRFAIGCECNGKRSSEDGGQDGQQVSKLIGNSPSFYAIWDFHGGGWSSGKGGGSGAEVTAAYCGSNNSYKQVGITIGVFPDGKTKTRTEDHYKEGGHQRASGDYNDLDSGVGVKNVPGFPANDFTIIWCADKNGNDVIYRGYIKVGKRGSPDTRKEIQIANIRNPSEGGTGGGGHHDSRTNIIDFTKQANTYMRGRIDKAGMNATATGTLYKGSYTPNSGPGYYYSGPEGYIEDEGWAF